MNVLLIIFIMSPEYAQKGKLSIHLTKSAMRNIFNWFLPSWTDLPLPGWPWCCPLSPMSHHHHQTRHLRLWLPERWSLSWPPPSPPLWMILKAYLFQASRRSQTGCPPVCCSGTRNHSRSGSLSLEVEGFCWEEKKEYEDGKCIFPTMRNKK